MNHDLLLSVMAGSALILIDILVPLSGWRRVRAANRSDGVSILGIGVLSGTAAGWITIAFLSHSISAAIAAALWFTFHVLLCREVIKVRPESKKVFFTAAGLTFFSLIFAALIGAIFGSVANGLGVGLGIASAAYAFPALIAGMTCKSTVGLSIFSIFINCIAGSLYLVAGLGLGGVSPAGSIVLGYVLLGSLELIANVPRLVRTAFRRLMGKDLLVTSVLCNA